MTNTVSRIISDETLSRVIQIESAGNPNAKAPTSSAAGLGQFIIGTWRDTIAYNNIRTGITNAVDEENEVYLGFDTDTIGSGSRFDDIHFNSTGASTWAAGIRDMIQAHIA